MKENRKTYLIDGKEVVLKKYEDLTVKEEESINKILTFEKKEVRINPFDLFPLVLEPTDEQIDFKNASYKQIFEILTDFLAERTRFLMNMPGMMENLLGRKMLQMQNTQENTESQKDSNQE